MGEELIKAMGVLFCIIIAFLLLFSFMWVIGTTIETHRYVQCLEGSIKYSEELYKCTLN